MAPSTACSASGLHGVWRSGDGASALRVDELAGDTNVIPGRFLPVRVAQQRRRVVRDDQRDAAELMDAPAQGAQRLPGVEQPLRRRVPHRQDDLGADQVKLAVQVRDAGVDLVLLRLAVVGRPALDHVADEHSFPGKLDGRQDLRQELSRAPNERSPGLVLGGPGAFPHHHQPRVGWSLARNRVASVPAQDALAALPDRGGEVIQGHAVERVGAEEVLLGCGNHDAGWRDGRRASAPVGLGSRRARSSAVGRGRAVGGLVRARLRPSLLCLHGGRVQDHRALAHLCTLFEVPRQQASRVRHGSASTASHTCSATSRLLISGSSRSPLADRSVTRLVSTSAPASGSSARLTTNRSRALAVSLFLARSSFSPVSNAKPTSTAPLGRSRLVVSRMSGVGSSASEVVPVARSRFSRVGVAGRKSAGAAAMIKMSARSSARATACWSCSVLSTRWISIPGGAASVVGPEISSTSAPRAKAASARAYPMRPLDRLVMTRTGSSASRVGPAVTTTSFPHSRLWGPRSNRSTYARISSGSLMRPGSSLGPSASWPTAGPTMVQPRCRSVARFCWVAGWAYIRSFMAGAPPTRTGRAGRRGGNKAIGLPP